MEGRGPVEGMPRKVGIFLASRNLVSLDCEATRVMGFDPNKWFGNVEVVAAKKIGRETVQYVSNIFKYYIAYRLVEEHKQEKLKNNL